MSERANRAIFRVLGLWMILGAIVGWGVSACMFYAAPVRFESAALVDAKERPGRSVGLAPIHAAQVIRLTRDRIQWDQPVAEAIDGLCKCTRITAHGDGVEIRVGRARNVHARDIALEIAWLFRGMDVEEALARQPVDLPPVTENDVVLQSERRLIEQVLGGETRDHIDGWIDFRLIPSLAARGNDDARKLWESESFQRQWKFLEDHHEKLAGGPPFASPPMRLVGLPDIADRPVSPQTRPYFSAGLLAGLAVGALVGFLRIRKMKFPAGEVMAGTSSAIPKAPPPVASGRRSTPEEEW